MSVAFQSELVPESCRLVGYAWLLVRYDLSLPLRTYCCISEKRLQSQHIEKGKWTVFDAQLKVEESVSSHLAFALKHENIDMLLLKAILKKWGKVALQSYILQNPKKILSRKLWFYYEFLLQERLSIDDLPSGKYDDLLDSQSYIVKNKPLKSKRHKINNNLLGSSDFTPVIRKTALIEKYRENNLDEKISEVIGTVSSSLMRRASSFLLLSDSKASFEIEGEHAPQNRIESWGKIINEAGKKVLSLQEIERLQAILFQDSRFTKIGLREEGVFLGDRDRNSDPIPEFVGARSEDLKTLMSQWLTLDTALKEDKINPIFHAVIIAFSFVYIHPLEDGNGRIHRYLIHHVLASRGFYPKGLIFPISNVILDEITKYAEILKSHTFPLMQAIKWETTDTHNVKVLNDTKDLYCYFDCTASCEFIYSCVEKTISETLPHELHYLASFDKAFSSIDGMIAMPDNKIKMLITLIIQNDGTLSKKKKLKYFAHLSDEELRDIERILQEKMKYLSI